MNNFINKLPDFYEDNSCIGRRDAMKGLSSLTIAISSLLFSIPNNNENFNHLGLSLACAGGILFFGYTGKAIYRNIQNELKTYQNRI